jgi:hypothetical protein
MTWYKLIKDVNLIYNYYADPGKYIEGKGWEYANLESRIRTGNRIYY